MDFLHDDKIDMYDVKDSFAFTSEPAPSLEVQSHSWTYVDLPFHDSHAALSHNQPLFDTGSGASSPNSAHSVHSPISPLSTTSDMSLVANHPLHVHESVMPPHDNSPHFSSLISMPEEMTPVPGLDALMPAPRPSSTAAAANAAAAVAPQQPPQPAPQARGVKRKAESQQPSSSTAAAAAAASASSSSTAVPAAKKAKAQPSAPSGEKDDKKRRLARKAELARLSRLRKKLRLQQLEQQVAALQEELVRERSMRKVAENKLVHLQQGPSTHLATANLSLADTVDSVVQIKNETTQDADLQQLQQQTQEAAAAARASAPHRSSSSRDSEAIKEYLEAFKLTSSATMHMLSGVVEHSRPSMPVRFLEWALGKGADFLADPQGLWSSLWSQTVPLTAQQRKRLDALQTDFQAQVAHAQRLNHAFEQYQNGMQQLLRNREQSFETFLRVLSPAQIEQYYAWINQFGAVVVNGSQV